MFTLPNFCRVCLKYDKNLIDLEHIENEPSETLMSKLQQCVSEVEWNVFKPLLCHPCIKRLNIAHGFKKQCIQSASVLKNYVALVQETKMKEMSEGVVTDGTVNVPATNNAYMMLPNKNYVKIVVGGQPSSASTFQNVFLNIVPNSAPTLTVAESVDTKDTNQNVFMNLNNAMQKYVPIAPLETGDKQVNVNQLLTEIKSEELSVEIDPTDFDLVTNDESSENEAENGEDNKDWDDVISQQVVETKMNGDSPEPNGGSTMDTTITKVNTYGNYVPILPKQNTDDFINSGQHFLSSTLGANDKDYNCGMCKKNFPTIKSLNEHLKEFHLDFETCIKPHKVEPQTLTLDDFKDYEPDSADTGEFCCELCSRRFTTTVGLLRHKVRKHNQRKGKKYFIKGMKNARCDVCNREFSTQSYMQLHKKLHLRDDIGYKYKVFGKSVYDNRLKMNNADKKENGEDKQKTKSCNDRNDNQNSCSADDKSVDADDEDRLVINEDDSEND